MSHKRVRAAMLLALCGATTQAQAQAPATAQVWDVRFVVDSSGPFAAGPTATQVGITIFARIGILAGAWGTSNFGVNRIGGPTFRASFDDPGAVSAGVDQGQVARGNTIDVDGRALTDTNGAALAGHFAPFRGSFGPQVGPLFLGSNDDPGNGELSHPANAAPAVLSLVGGRTFNFGSEGSGPLGVAGAIDDDPMNLIGDLAAVYRMYYLPTARFGGTRMITLNASGITARYIVFTVGFPVSSGAVALADQQLSFQVPGPVPATVLLGAAALAARRRRCARVPGTPGLSTA